MIDRRTLIAGLSAAALIAAKPNKGPKRLTLAGAKDRKIEFWKWPANGRRKGRIHFSHGNFSSPIKYDRLLAFWAANGWDVLAPLHVDSADHPDKSRYGPMDSWAARLEDLALLGADVGKEGYIATGHSYGALMALVLGGVQPLLPGGKRDSLAKAAIALSPPGAMPGFIDAAGYASLAIPALIQTGDKDIFPGNPPEAWREHLLAFEQAAPGGGRHALVYAGVDHYFGGVIGRPELSGPKAETQFGQFLESSDQFLNCFDRAPRRAKNLSQLRFEERAGVSWLKR